MEMRDIIPPKEELYYCNGADPTCPGYEKCEGHKIGRGTYDFAENMDNNEREQKIRTFLEELVPEGRESVEGDLSDYISPGFNICRTEILENIKKADVEKLMHDLS